nr:NAD(+)/NADH kinase [Desulfobacterales bacterium]
MKKKIGIAVKAKADALEKAVQLEKWLKERGVEVVFKPNTPPLLEGNLKDDKPRAAKDISCVVSLGGDGTFLSAVHWVNNSGVPVLGINMGNVGFLTEAPKEQLFSIMERVLSDNYSIEKRMLLTATVFRDKNKVASHTVLNDVVVNIGTLARITHLDAYVDDNYLATFKGDGIIVSTPTGSTAYSIAAGGPIIYPQLETIMITPICPFTTTNRSIVLPDSVTVKIKIRKKNSDTFLTLDGQIGLSISDEDTVIVKRAVHDLNMVRVQEQRFFDVLNTKLKWNSA